MKRASWFIGLFFSVVVSCIGQDGITGTWKAEDVGFAPWTFTFEGGGCQSDGYGEPRRIQCDGYNDVDWGYRDLRRHH